MPVGTSPKPRTSMPCRWWLQGTQTLGSDTTSQHFRLFQPWGSMNIWDQSDTANYHGLQVTARRNVANGLTLLAAYTWSKALGYGSDPFDRSLTYGPEGQGPRPGLCPFVHLPAPVTRKEAFWRESGGQGYAGRLEAFRDHQIF